MPSVRAPPTGPASLRQMHRLHHPRPPPPPRMAPWPMTPDNGLGPGLFPLSAVYKFRPASTDEQLSLIGDPIPVRISAVEWTTWLTDVSVRTRYWAKVHRTSPAEDCWFFIGGISSTGHATFRAASRPGRTRRGTVPGHLYGYQLARGVIPRLGWGAGNLTVCHTCDNHSCQQPTHLRLGTAAENRAEWVARRRDPGSPLADLRGPAGRSRAVGAAIRAGLAVGEPEAEIAVRVRAAIAEGRPLSLW